MLLLVHVKLPEINVGDVQITFPVRRQCSGKWTGGRSADGTVRRVRPAPALSNIHSPRYRTLKSRSPVMNFAIVKKITFVGDFVTLGFAPWNPLEEEESISPPSFTATVLFDFL